MDAALSMTRPNYNEVFLEPRLQTSVKWSPFPEELCQQIKDVMAEAFSDFDIKGEFVAEGLICPNEIVMRIGLNSKNQLRQNNFEASMEYSGEEEKAIEKIHFMMDFLGEAWEKFLDEEPETEDLPLVWTEHRFEKNILFLRYSSVNSNLEKQADELLKQFEKKLLHEQEEEDIDELIKAHELKLQEDDEQHLH